MKKYILIIVAMFMMNVANAQLQKTIENTNSIDKSVPSPAGAIIGPDSICTGDTLILSVQPITGATSYIWTLPSGFNGTSSSDSIKIAVSQYPVFGGYVTVRGHNSDGDGSADSLYIKLIETPTISFDANPLIGCEPLLVTFNNYSIPMESTYMWKFGDGDSSSIINPIHNYSAGLYSVTITATNKGCHSSFTVNSFIKVISCADINEITSNESIHIYPNPAKENLTIETNLNTQQKLEIINFIGQTVYTSIINNKKTTINTSAFADGVYILKLSSDKETLVKKFVKE